MTADATPSPELAEARRRLAELESLVEISPVAVIVMDADERVTDWNPAAAELFGYSAEEALGRPIDDLVLGDAGRDEGREVTREAIATGRAQRIARRTRKDGTRGRRRADARPRSRSTASTSASSPSTTTSPSSSAHASTPRRSWP